MGEWGKVILQRQIDYDVQRDKDSLKVALCLELKGQKGGLNGASTAPVSNFFTAVASFPRIAQPICTAAVQPLEKLTLNSKGCCMSAHKNWVTHAATQP